MEHGAPLTRRRTLAASSGRPRRGRRESSGPERRGCVIRPQLPRRASRGGDGSRRRPHRLLLATVVPASSPGRRRPLALSPAARIGLDAEDHGPVPSLGEVALSRAEWLHARGTTSRGARRAPAVRAGSVSPPRRRAHRPHPRRFRGARSAPAARTRAPSPMRCSKCRT